MPDTFSDVSDDSIREMLLGFVEQIRSGKPAAVITMVMKSRLPNQPALWDRVVKAATGAAPATSKSSPAASAKASKASKAKSPSSNKSPTAPKSIPSPPPPPPAAPSSPPPASASPSPQSSTKRSKDKTKKPKKEKMKNVAKQSSPVLLSDNDSDDDNGNEDGYSGKKKKKKESKPSAKHSRRSSGYSDTASPRSVDSSDRSPIRVTATESLLDLTKKERKNLEKSRKVAEARAEEARLQRLASEREARRKAAMHDPNEALYGRTPLHEDDAGCCSCVVS